MSIYESFYGKEIKQITLQEKNKNNTDIEVFAENIDQPSKDSITVETNSEFTEDENNSVTELSLKIDELTDIDSLEGTLLFH